MRPARRRMLSESAAGVVPPTMGLLDAGAAYMVMSVEQIAGISASDQARGPSTGLLGGCRSPRSRHELVVATSC